MGFDRALVVVAIVAFFKINYVDSIPWLETISNYAKVAKNEKLHATTTEASPRTASLEMPSNETMDTVDYEDFDDIEEDRSLKQVSAGDSMVKFFTGLISLMGLLQGLKNAHHNKIDSSLGLKPQKLNFKNENEPRKTKIGKRIQKVEERFLPYQETKNNGNMKDLEFQPVENYPPYNPITANAAETYMKDGKKTSYEVYNSQNSIDHYNHKDKVEIIPSYSYEIPYEASKQVNQNSEVSNQEEKSWSNQDIRPVYQPWMSKVQTSLQPSLSDSYLSWNSKPQDKVKPEPDGVTHDQSIWQGKIPPDDFSMYHHNFKNPPPPPSSLDHHFDYEEIDHPPEDHALEEDRVNKKPYSYYFLGRKLWYIPLLFSVYFIVYIGALVLKSIARHKIQFPEKVWDLHDHHADHVYGHGKYRRHRNIDRVSETVENAIDKMKNKFI